MSRDADHSAPRTAAAEPRPADPARRRLLTAAPLAGAAALASGTGRADQPEPPADDKRTPGYRVTDHIAAYYRRARG